MLEFKKRLEKFVEKVFVDEGDQIMSVKYHIGEKGDPSPCRAEEGKCPLGGEHFDSVDDARKAYESSQSENIIPVKKKKTTLSAMSESELLSEISSRQYTARLANAVFSKKFSRSEILEKFTELQEDRSNSGLKKRCMLLHCPNSPLSSPDVSGNDLYCAAKDQPLSAEHHVFNHPNMTPAAWDKMSESALHPGARNAELSSLVFDRVRAGKPVSPAVIKTAAYSNPQGMIDGLESGKISVAQIVTAPGKAIHPSMIARSVENPDHLDGFTDWAIHNLDVPENRVKAEQVLQEIARGRNAHNATFAKIAQTGKADAELYSNPNTSDAVKTFVKKSIPDAQRIEKFDTIAGSKHSSIAEVKKVLEVSKTEQSLNYSNTHNETIVQLDTEKLKKYNVSQEDVEALYRHNFGEFEYDPKSGVVRFTNDSSD